MTNYKVAIYFAILVMGFSGLVAQTVLIRELLVIFSGNELSIGIIFAHWFIFESLGCFFFGKKAEQTKNALGLFSSVTILFSLFFFLAIFITRILKPLLGVSLGENIGFIPMFFSSCIILLPVSITHGALFPLSCSIYNLFSSESSVSAGKVYACETIGTMLGGIICTYILFPYVNSFEVITYLALLNFIVCLVLLLMRWQSTLVSKIIFAVLNGLTIIIGIFIFAGGSGRLHTYSIKKQFTNQNVLHYQNSIYSNYCVLENQGQYIFFMDGVPEIITPFPDVTFVEEFVHLPLATHQRPKEVLIVSGGAGGIINEILRYESIEIVDYVELDPLILQLLKKFSTPLTERELNDRRVKIHYTDGRFYLKYTDRKYDLIFSGIMEPSTLQTNRFFTKEYFRLVRSRLKTDGIYVLGLPGSLNYSNDELRNLNSCIFTTLKGVFRFIKALPGSTNIFLASDSDRILRIEKDKLIERLNQQNIKTDIIMPWYIEQKLHPGWQNWFLSFIEQGSKKINSDFKPVGLFYNIGHWISLFEPNLRMIFKIFEGLNLMRISLFVLALLFVYLFLNLIKIRLPPMGIPFSILTTGFAGIIFDLMIIFTFQSLYGYVFSWIGLLIAFFMAGSACGAIFITKFLSKIADYLRLFRLIDLAIISFSIVLPFTLILMSKTAFFSKFLFLTTSFVCGFLVGSQFPLANAIYLEKNVGIIKTAGLFYSFDLLGGWVGGLSGAIILLPVLGLVETSITITLVKFLSFFVLTTRTN